MSISFSEIFPAEVVAVQGKPYLFSNMRIDRKSVPDRFYAYDVADGDGDGEFWRIQKYVMVNHWATIIGLEQVDLDDNGQFWCEPDEKEPDFSKEGIFINFVMEDQADYVVWYHSLKDYARAAQEA